MFCNVRYKSCPRADGRFAEQRPHPAAHTAAYWQIRAEAAHIRVFTAVADNALHPFAFKRFADRGVEYGARPVFRLHIEVARVQIPVRFNDELRRAGAAVPAARAPAVKRVRKLGKLAYVKHGFAFFYIRVPQIEKFNEEIRYVARLPLSALKRRQARDELDDTETAFFIIRVYFRRAVRVVI